MTPCPTAGGSHEREDMADCQPSCQAPSLRPASALGSPAGLAFRSWICPRQSPPGGPLHPGVKGDQSRPPPGLGG